MELGHTPTPTSLGQGQAVPWGLDRAPDRAGQARGLSKYARGAAGPHCTQVGPVAADSGERQPTDARQDPPRSRRISPPRQGAACSTPPAPTSPLPWPRAGPGSLAPPRPLPGQVPQCAHAPQWSRPAVGRRPAEAAPIPASRRTQSPRSPGEITPHHPEPRLPLPSAPPPD